MRKKMALIVLFGAVFAIHADGLAKLKAECSGGCGFSTCSDVCRDACNGCTHCHKPYGIK